MSKTILVPTDFSTNALRAATYAIQLGKRMDCTVHLLHAYAAFHSPFQSELANRTDEQRAQLGAQKGMRSFMDTLGISDDDMHVSQGIVKAELVRAVRHYADAHEVLAIVMGTHGASGVKAGLLGSNTFDVAKAASVPLLAMPLNAEDVVPKHVVFFTDYREADGDTITGLVSLFGGLIQKCTLVHIHGGPVPPTAEDTQRLSAWKDGLQAASGFDRIDTDLIQGQESLALVDESLEKHQATLTALTLVGGRSFFEKLTHKSLAKAIILQPKVPVLLLRGEVGDFSPS